MKLNFRTLRADEIECRIAMVKASGVSLLLYKDARCDMNILDETVGPMNWQRRHERNNANCVVSIWDDTKNQWVSKEDTGTESFTEKEKGLASDSFKRACFNWCIGRELYTAPFIWIGPDKCIINEIGSGSTKKYTCSDRFRVSRIAYDEKRSIVDLQIKNAKNIAVYDIGSPEEEPPLRPLINKTVIKALKQKLVNENKDIQWVLDSYKIKSFEEMSIKQHANLIENFGLVPEEKHGN